MGTTFYERIAGRGELGKLPPDPELAKVHWLIGVWSTGGVVFATETTDEKTYESQGVRLRWSLEMSGYALKMSNATNDGAGGVLYLYVDPYDKSWVSLTLEPNVRWGVQVSDGWDGNVLQWEDDVRIFDDIARWRHRFVKKSDDEWLIENDELQSDGKWRPIDMHWFRRAGS